METPDLRQKTSVRKPMIKLSRNKELEQGNILWSYRDCETERELFRLFQEKKPVAKTFLK